MLVGDDVKKVAEAATFAKKLIGCTILENTPYYRSSGHVQVRPSARMIEQHPAGVQPCSTTLKASLHALLLRWLHRRFAGRDCSRALTDSSMSLKVFQRGALLCGNFKRGGGGGGGMTLYHQVVLQRTIVRGFAGVRRWSSTTRRWTSGA